MPELQGLRDNGGVAAGEESVGEPSGVERIGGVNESTAVNVERETYKKMAVTEFKLVSS